jgi:hypothetical protein
MKLLVWLIPAICILPVVLDIFFPGVNPIVFNERSWAVVVAVSGLVWVVNTLIYLKRSIA